jgi:hypothetical protein
MTTAAIALEEQRAATAPTEEATMAASAIPVTAPSVAPVTAPARAARARVLLGAILVVETGWLAVLGLFAYKLIT